jgi:hypothetical protein
MSAERVAVVRQTPPEACDLATTVDIFDVQ